jgi:hypothetical protein
MPVRDLGTEEAGVLSVAAPTAWDYRLVVVVYDGGVDLAGALAVTPPTQWSYQRV